MGSIVSAGQTSTANHNNSVFCYYYYYYLIILCLQNLQDFLDLYYEACSVLVKEEDFYDLMDAYLRKAAENSVMVAEIFFDPQTHTERGIPFESIINGLHRALCDGYRHYNIKGSLIMCFLRHLSEDKAIQTLEEAAPHLDKILGVGLDSGESGNPPEKFEKVFSMARSLGLRAVAHAGEEEGPEYIRGALDLLKAKRIDHGVQCLSDDDLVARLATSKVPLTVCPLSNVKLQVVSRFFSGESPVKELLDKGIMVTINSDDPAYFGGYINDNFVKAVRDCGLTAKDVYKMCQNSFNASFLSLVEKDYFLWRLDQFNIETGFAPPPKSIAVFGSQKPPAGTPAYEIARKLGRMFASRGYQISSGGYNGIMAAVSHGASEEGGKAFGILAPRVFRSRNDCGNKYLTKSMFSSSFSNRTIDLVETSEYLVAFPGNMGTFTEVVFTWCHWVGRSERNYPVKKLYIYREPLGVLFEDVMKRLDIPEEQRRHVIFFESLEKVLEDVESDYEERKKKAIF